MIWEDCTGRTGSSSLASVVSACEDGAAVVAWTPSDKRKYGGTKYYAHGPRAVTPWLPSREDAKKAYENGVSVEPYAPKEKKK